MADEDEFEAAELLDEQEAPVQDAPAEEALSPEPGSPEAQMAEMKAQLAALASAPKDDSGVKELVNLGRTFLANQQQQNQPREAPVDPAQLEAFGRELQEALLTKQPAEAAAYLLQTMNAVSERNVNAAISRAGAPLADRAGDYTVATYLTGKRDEVGESGAKLHKLIAKELTFTSAEKQGLALASSAQAKEYMDAKYERAAGKVLIASSGRAKPRDISGGGSGGSSRGPSAIPGLNPVEQRRLERLAESYWPDPKVRAVKMKGMIDEMTSTGT